MDLLALLKNALAPAPTEILRAILRSSYQNAVSRGLNQTRLASLLGTNRRTLQRMVSTDFESARRDTLINSIARQQERSVLFPERVGKNYTVFTTPTGTSEWVSQIRDAASSERTPVSFKIDIQTDESGYDRYKSIKSVAFGMFDQRIDFLGAEGLDVSKISRVTFRY